MRRYDIYGFRNQTLEEAALLVERSLNIHLMRRDSSYRGIYYCAGEGFVNDYLLQMNDEEPRRFSEYDVTLIVSNLADMDAMREKLISSSSDVVFLGSIIDGEEPLEEYPINND
jgi:hypothetical protein